MEYREIKYKVFFKDKLYGYEKLDKHEWTFMCPELNPDNFERWCSGVFKYGPHDRVQFTGISDINKKEIYEGDFLSMDMLSAKPGTVIDNNIDEPVFLVPPQKDYMIGTVKFINCGFYLCLKTDEEEMYTEIDSTMEVIGNIFENKELL